MKKLFLMGVLFGLVWSLSISATAQDQPAAKQKSAKSELDTLVGKIQGVLKEKGSDTTAADLAPFFTEFDGLIARHKDEKTDDLGRIYFMKAKLYGEVLHDSAKASEVFQQLAHDLPATKYGKQAELEIAGLKQSEEIEKIQKQLVKGSPFPDFAEKDLEGKPLSIGGHKGKLVLVDFWATWCGPCRAELPNVLETYHKFHEKGLDIVGISLDSDRQKLDSFLKEQGMTWPQYFDGQGWQNKLAAKYGVNSIPATYLIDAEGNILAKDLRGEALASKVAMLLGSK